MKRIISKGPLLNSRKFKNFLSRLNYEQLCQKSPPPHVWQIYDLSKSGSSYWCVFSILRYSAEFDCTPNFSERLYCTSESDSYLFIVRSERYQLYEVNVNGDHKTCIISTEAYMFYKKQAPMISMFKYLCFGFSIVPTHFSCMPEL